MGPLSMYVPRYVATTFRSSVTTISLAPNLTLRTVGTTIQRSPPKVAKMNITT